MSSSRRPRSNAAVLPSDLRPRRVTLRASDEKDAVFEIEVVARADLELSWRQSKPKYGSWGLAKVAERSLAKPKSLLFFFTHSVAANGKYLKDSYVTEARKPASRINGALLPFWRSPVWSSAGPLKLNVGLVPCKLVRTSDVWSVRVELDGQRLKVPCLCWEDTKQNVTLWVAEEGPLAGMVVVARRENSAMRLLRLES
ncbi:MAG: hypothetical protein Q8N26_11015 [Myxococcales bacterium]|nr:hypothetical protein [Myxococcales bacterium]